MFIFVGNLNKLAPIVTMPFLTTYMAINYAYFAMAMSYDVKLKQTARVEYKFNNNNKNSIDNNGGKVVTTSNGGYGTLVNQRSFEGGVKIDPSDEKEDVFDTHDAVEQKDSPEDTVLSFPKVNVEMGDERTKNSSEDELNVESNLVSAEDIGGV